MTTTIYPWAWAFLGKDPGDKGDYRVLRQGPGGGRDDLATQVWAALPSIPQLGGMPGPGTLPWVTFIPGQEGDAHGLAVTVIDATDILDAVGRPTVAIRHVRLAFAEVARAAAGYRALYAAVPPQPEMAEPLAVALASGDGSTEAELADDGCFARAAALAALLLSGDVMVTLGQQDFLPLAWRLAEFDRALALLPFGLRAGITLATWHDGSVGDDGREGAMRSVQFRFAYGPFATRGQAAVRCGPGAEVRPPADEPAGQYLRDLMAARDRFGVPALTAHLARHGAPLEAGDAPQALEILRSLEHPRLVLTAIREGRASLDRVLNARRQASLSPDARAELDEYLLAKDDPLAEAEVLGDWSPWTARAAAGAVLSWWPDRTIEEVIAAARRLRAAAASHGEAEDFLVALTDGRSRPDAAIPVGVIAEVIARLSAPRRGELPALRAAVVHRARLGRWLLRHSLRGEAVDWAWLEWLDPAGGESVPQWLRPYARLSEHWSHSAPPEAARPEPEAAAPDPETPEAIEPEDLEARPEDLVLIASFAIREGDMPQRIVTWWPVLLWLARGHATAHLPELARADLKRLVSEACTDPAPGLAAATRLDTLRCYLKLAPRLRYLPPTATAAAGQEYVDVLGGLWSRRPADPADMEMLTVELLGSLSAAPFADEDAPRSLGDAAIAVLRAVVTDERITLSPPIAASLAGLVATRPGLAEDPRLDDRWWARVERLAPGVRSPAVRLSAAVRDPGSDAVAVAVLMGRAASGMPPAQLHEVAADWLARRQPHDIAAMLNIIEGVLHFAGERSQGGEASDAYLEALRDLLNVPSARSGRRRRRDRASG